MDGHMAAGPHNASWDGRTNDGSSGLIGRLLLQALDAGGDRVVEHGHGQVVRSRPHVSAGAALPTLGVQERAALQSL